MYCVVTERIGRGGLNSGRLGGVVDGRLAQQLGARRCEVCRGRANTQRTLQFQAQGRVGMLAGQGIDQGKQAVFPRQGELQGLIVFPEKPVDLGQFIGAKQAADILSNTYVVRRAALAVERETVRTHAGRPRRAA